MVDAARQLDAFTSTPFLDAATPRLALDEWAERHRIVVGETPFPGPWNPANAPMALEPMRAVTDDRVRTVVVVTPSQLMKSEFAVNCACYAAFYGDTCLFYEPERELLAKFLGDRVRPSMYAIGLLDKEERTPGPLKKRDSKMEIRANNGGTVTGLTPEMKMGRSAYTGRYVVLDELDKMGRTDMMVIARERSTVYGADAKVVAVSTPTVAALGTVWREWEMGSRGVWMGWCPHCGDLTSMDWDEAAQFGRTDDGLWIPDTECMGCMKCGAAWDEHDRLAAARAGQYVHADPANDQRTFRVPGPAHLFRTLRDIMTAGAETYRAAVEEQNWEGYIAWRNGMAALCWDESFKGLSATALEGHTWAPGPRGENDLGELPAGALLITAGADVGARHIACEWVAWGIDKDSGRVRSWALRYVRLGDAPDDSTDEPDLWDAFDEEIRRSVWRTRTGRFMQAVRVFVDEGHRPEVVRTWCQNRYLKSLPAGRRRASPYDAQVGPVRGYSAEASKPKGYPVDLELGIQKRKHQPQFVPATVFAMTGTLKERMYDWMLADKSLPAEAERAHIYPEAPELSGYTAAYFKQLAHEVKEPEVTPTGRVITRWKKRHGFIRNEPMDCRIYALAALYTQAYLARTFRLDHYLTRLSARQRGAGNVVSMPPR